MATERYDKKQILNYLLGELPEADQSQVELRLIKDPGFLKETRSVENDLIDDYLDDTLTAENRRLFEEVFVKTPYRQEKIAFAKNLETVLSETAAPVPVAPERINAGWAATFRSLRLSPYFLRYAAAILLVAMTIVSFWLYADRNRVRRELVQSQAEKVRRDNEAVVAQSRTEEVSKQLEAERVARLQQEQIAQQLQRERDELGKRQSDKSGVFSSIATFVLSPGLTRGSDEPTRLVVPRAASQIRLQLDLQTGENYGSYRAELRTTGGNVIWSSTPKPRLLGGGKVIILSLPPSLLNSGEYELTLSARNAKSQFEDIGYYYFSVLIRDR